MKCWYKSDCCRVEVNLATLTCWGYYQVLGVGVSLSGWDNATLWEQYYCVIGTILLVWTMFLCDGYNTTLCGYNYCVIGHCYCVGAVLMCVVDSDPVW